MMKISKFILLILIIFTPLKAIETYVELKVNNEIITNIDLNTQYKYLIALNNELKNANKETVLKLARESIIREVIKKNEISKYYVFESSDDFLDDVIENFHKKMNIENLNDFEVYLNQYNLTLDDVRYKVKIEMLWNRLIGSKYKSQINIRENILKQQIEKDSNNSMFVKEYELSEIVFQIDNKNDLNNKMILIQRDIDDKGFRNTANIYSISDSAKFGGNIGWITEKQLSQEINLAIEKLEIGEISKPIKVVSGFLILKIENKKEKIFKKDKKKILEQAITFETNKQYGQFSIIYYNQIRLNSIISE
ncbi:peptidylprolyl isomerase [Candidatus Pelagibacter sp.]|jgi:peptidyl-prolyl cis-trans isomerase SurA|nr:peptidylprolyl isomerase [Candidatus Pelagibacter sp.]